MEVFCLCCTIVGLCAVVYILALYPLSMAALAKMRPRPVRRAPVTPAVSVIISAYNEAPFVAEKIRNTLALNYPADRLEIIFSSDGSTDGSERLAAAYGEGRVRVIHHARRQGKPSAMNRGMEAASGELLLFSDARPLFGPDALACMVSAFADPEVGLVNGDVIYAARADSDVGRGNNAYGRFENWLRSNESACGSTMTVHGAIMAVRRELVRPLPEDIVNDDAYVALTVLGRGKRVVYEPRAVAAAPSPAKMADDMERRYRISAGRFQLLFRKGLLPRNAGVLWRYFSHKAGRLLLPLFLVLAFLPGALGCLFLERPPLLLVLLILPQALVYLLAAAGRLRQAVTGSAGLCRLPYYAVRGAYSPVVGFYRYIAGKQHVTWERSNRETA